MSGFGSTVISIHCRSMIRMPSGIPRDVRRECAGIGESRLHRTPSLTQLGPTRCGEDTCRPWLTSLGPWSFVEFARSGWGSSRPFVWHPWSVHNRCCHSSWPELEPYRPLWFEEPIPPDNFLEFAQVAKSIRIPVATGERLCTKAEFGTLLRTGGAYILQPALGRVGGIWEAKKIAATAEVFNAQLAPHLYAGPVEWAANLQLAVSIPNLLMVETIETRFHEGLIRKFNSGQ